jgi:ABC-type polysaccharide/polyol phosphate transport system ATPase subunit
MSPRPAPQSVDANNDFTPVERDEIVAFSNFGRFIDTPVRYHCS